MILLPNFRAALAVAGAAALAALTPMAAAATTAPSAAADQVAIEARRAAAERLMTSMKRQTGTVHIASANADLNLGDAYYFVGPEDARTILVDVWRNPPGSATGVLGMVFPKGKSFVDDTWSAVITFEDTGYVSDKDAKTIDYNEMLANMKAADEEQAPITRAEGYPAGILQRWAQAPTYDAQNHSLVWARDIKFDGSTEDTLNYDIRLLGRSGVLSMNILAGMSQLGEVHEAAKTFANVGSFRTGARYADYNPSTDKKAEYGLAGLVAARRRRGGGEEGRAFRGDRQVRQVHPDRHRRAVRGVPQRDRRVVRPQARARRRRMAGREPCRRAFRRRCGR
ncbi:DUF2167 domain-containing protein [Sphingopyxis sp. PET50]|uniref:DUF2167 domain-containing protein n=1 Tax=Sphingopyxis sp. PET50 TaxID=2976533 RepID=UPI0021AFA599|nr:DUF2167 domain-containing protein [Sphingopyxis sp. PET50]